MRMGRTILGTGPATLGVCGDLTSLGVVLDALDGIGVIGVLIPDAIGLQGVCGVDVRVTELSNIADF